VREGCDAAGSERDIRAVIAVDIGGSHVSAAKVLLRPRPTVQGDVVHSFLDSHGSADAVLSTVAQVARAAGVMPGSRIVVAIPGPFEYEAGIARFTGVGKFDNLFGVDVRRELTTRIAPPPSEILFLNDAHAFLWGESVSGAAAGHRCAIAVTLGTGIGSAFRDADVLVTSGPSVPPEGRVDLLTLDGRALESYVSSRAIRDAYSAVASVRQLGQGSEPDVQQIAHLARNGDPHAQHVIATRMEKLGGALAPWIVRFRPNVVVFGGSIVNSWDLVRPSLIDGLGTAGLDKQLASALVVRAQNIATATLLGAAYCGDLQSQP
jgi:glucokinase